METEEGVGEVRVSIVSFLIKCVSDYTIGYYLFLFITLITVVASIAKNQMSEDKKTPCLLTRSSCQIKKYCFIVLSRFCIHCIIIFFVFKGSPGLGLFIRFQALYAVFRRERFQGRCHLFMPSQSV